jgi:hypothetical protein
MLYTWSDCSLSGSHSSSSQSIKALCEEDMQLNLHALFTSGLNVIIFSIHVPLLWERVPFRLSVLVCWVGPSAALSSVAKSSIPYPSTRDQILAIHITVFNCWDIHQRWRQQVGTSEENTFHERTACLFLCMSWVLLLCCLSCFQPHSLIPAMTGLSLADWFLHYQCCNMRQYGMLVCYFGGGFPLAPRLWYSLLYVPL